MGGCTQGQKKLVAVAVALYTGGLAEMEIYGILEILKA